MRSTENEYRFTAEPTSRRLGRRFPKIFRRWKHPRPGQLAAHQPANLLRPIRPGQFADAQMPPRRLILRAAQEIHAEHRHSAGPEKSRIGFSLSAFGLPRVQAPAQGPLSRPSKI